MFLNWFQEWLVRTSVRDRYGPIYLVDMTANQEDDGFVTFTKQALNLIERTDPRRYRRVEREIRYIVNTYLVSSAEYRRGIRRCSVDFARYKVDPSHPRYEWYLASFACTLIHEATH